MTGFLAFDSRFSSITSDWNILSSVRLQNIYSHLEECTEIPWGSLTLMVIYLTLVNGIHQSPVIKWFLPCLMAGHLFTWIESYYLELESRPWMVRFCLNMCLYLGCDRVIIDSLHGSTLYVWWLWLSLGQDDIDI